MKHAPSEQQQVSDSWREVVQYIHQHVYVRTPSQMLTLSGFVSSSEAGSDV